MGYMGVQIPMGRGKFWGRHSTVVCAKTAEPIGMPFELWGDWGQMGRGNRVRWGSRGEVLTDFDVAANFGTQIAVIGFVGYNFGCMTASNTLFDSSGGSSGSSYPMKT